MTRNGDLARLVEELNRKSIPVGVRHKFLTMGTEAFDELLRIASDPKMPTRQVVNSLLILKEFCLWIDKEKRESVLKLASLACQNANNVMRGAGVRVVIGVCRTHEIAPDTMSISNELLDEVAPSLKRAIDLGLDEHESHYASWYLDR